MAGSGFEFDASDFFAGLRRGGQLARDAASKALTGALLDYERRAKEATPVDQGTLMRGIHARTNEIVVTEEKIEGIVATGAESSDYAITQHEDVLHHTHPVEGTYAAKFLEKPLKEMGQQYAQAVSDAVRGALGGN